MPSLRVASCVWQTTTSCGELVELPSTGAALDPAATHVSPGSLSQLMRRMRPDLRRPGSAGRAGYPALVPADPVITTDVQLAARDYGGPGRDVLLLHGGGRSMDDWRLVAPSWSMPGCARAPSRRTGPASRATSPRSPPPTRSSRRPPCRPATTCAWRRPRELADLVLGRLSS